MEEYKIKTIQASTNADETECKKALQLVEGEINAAIDYLTQLKEIMKIQLKRLFDRTEKLLEKVKEENDEEKLSLLGELGIITNESALSVLNKYNFIDLNKNKVLIYYYLGYFSLLKKEKDNSRIFLNLALDLAKKLNNEYENEVIANIYLSLAETSDNLLESYNYTLRALEFCNNDLEKIKLLKKNEYLINTKQFKYDFQNEEFAYIRKFILVIDDNIFPIFSDAFIALNQKTLRKMDLRFPIGHPVVGTLYAKHPLSNNFYVPYTQINDSIFIERIYEYCYLLSSLGAKEISISVIHGKTVDELTNRQIEGLIEGNKSIIKGDLQYNSSKKSQNNFTQQLKLQTRQSFDKKKTPEIPKDLKWRHLDPKWDRIITQRLQNKLIEFSEDFCTNDICVLSKEEERICKAAINLFFTKISGNLKYHNAENSYSSVDTSWKIDVIFY